MRLSVTVLNNQIPARMTRVKKAAQQGLSIAVGIGANTFVDAAKTLVPVDTGNLQDHIHAEVIEDTPQRQVRAVTPAFAASNKYGFDPAYARRIEYGFHGTDSLGRQYDQGPQPYMRPAFDEHQSEVSDQIKATVRGFIPERLS